MLSELNDIYRGGCAAWLLPKDSTGPSTARSLIRKTLAAMKLPDALVDDAVTMVSELSTNAHLYGQHPGPATTDVAPELWLYLVRRPRTRLMCKVFDGNRLWEPPDPDLGPLDETGRGLRIVETLSDAWGVHPTRARLAPWRPPGKAVWFTCALPEPQAALAPPPPRLTAAQAAEELRGRLTERGVTAQCKFGGADLALVSVRHGLTVWVHHGLSWQSPGGGYISSALADVEDAAEMVLALNEELAALQPDPYPSSIRRPGSNEGVD